MLTILYPYRNKDLTRVINSLGSLANQKNKNFSVLFVDFGSNEFYETELLKVCDNYDFVNVIKSYSNGMLWSRSMALNIGLRVINTDYVLVSDIDMIYHPEFIDLVYNKMNKKSVVYFKVGFLSEDTEIVNFDFDKPIVESYSRDYSMGICLFPLKESLEIRGYDEFYKIWGGEDNDFIGRLERKGLSSLFYEASVLIFHQYHPKHAKPSKNTVSIFIDDLFIINKKKCEDNISFKGYEVNSGGWGEVQTKESLLKLIECNNIIRLTNNKKDIDIYINYWLHRVSEPTRFVFNIKRFNAKLCFYLIRKRKYFKIKNQYYKQYDLNQILLKRIIYNLHNKYNYIYDIKNDRFELTVAPK